MGGSGHGGEDWRATNILRLLVYTGARLSEILTLQWTWIHWGGGFARLPDSKTGTKNVPLPQPALDVLRKVSEEHGRPSKFVFPGARSGTYFTGIQNPWQRIRLKAGLPDVRIHDLRHCFASTAGKPLPSRGCSWPPHHFHDAALRAPGHAADIGIGEPHIQQTRGTDDGFLHAT